MKVFLGGTCVEPDYRKELIPLLKCDYFNPVVDDWDEGCRLNEEREKKICNIHLYVITGKQEGYYSFTELGVDSVKLGKGMVLCILKDQFPDSKLKSLEAIENLCKENGSIVCSSLQEVANYLNDLYIEERIFNDLIS